MLKGVKATPLMILPYDNSVPFISRLYFKPSEPGADREITSSCRTTTLSNGADTRVDEEEGNMEDHSRCLPQRIKSERSVDEEQRAQCDKNFAWKVCVIDDIRMFRIRSWRIATFGHSKWYGTLSEKANRFTTVQEARTVENRQRKR